MLLKLTKFPKLTVYDFKGENFTSINRAIIFFTADESRKAPPVTRSSTFTSSRASSESIMPLLDGASLATAVQGLSLL
jgi:hypothetical protein